MKSTERNLPYIFLEAKKENSTYPKLYIYINDKINRQRTHHIREGSVFITFFFNDSLSKFSLNKASQIITSLISPGGTCFMAFLLFTPVALGAGLRT